MSDKLRLHLSFAPFGGVNRKAVFDECVVAAEHYGFEFGIQLHNSASKIEIERCVELGAPLSAHAPLLTAYSLNLAQSETALESRELGRTASLMRRYNITDAVFHGFRMSDIPTPAFNREKSFTEAMMVGFRPELAARPGSTLNRDFTGEIEFAERFGILHKNLSLMRTNYPDLNFCIENDFPSYGMGNMLSENVVSLEHPICLDTGHLWITSYLFNRDFHNETAIYAASGLVKMVHLHASPFTMETPFEQWADGHLPLRTPNQMDLPRFVRSCRDADVRLFVLEIPSGSVEDIHEFAKMWEA